MKETGKRFNVYWRGLYGVSSSRLGEVWPRYTLAGALRILWSFGVTWGHWLAIERPSFTIVVRCFIPGDWPERELKERQLQVSVTKWKLVLIWCVSLSPIDLWVKRNTKETCRRDCTLRVRWLVSFGARFYVCQFILCYGVKRTKSFKKKRGWDSDVLILYVSWKLKVEDVMSTRSSCFFVNQNKIFPQVDNSL